MAATHGEPAGVFLQYIMVGYHRRSYTGGHSEAGKVEYLTQGWRHALHVARRIRAHHSKWTRLCVRGATIADLSRPQRRWGGEGW